MNDPDIRWPDGSRLDQGTLAEPSTEIHFDCKSCGAHYEMTSSGWVDLSGYDCAECATPTEKTVVRRKKQTPPS